MIPIPDGYRLLTNGEKIKSTDLFYRQVAKEWAKMQRGMAGKIYNDISYVEMIRKKDSQ